MSSESRASQAELVVLAGATGNLGRRIAGSLRQRGARVRAIVRRESTSTESEGLIRGGVEVVRVNYRNPSELEAACKGGTCIVSALSGLRDVIVDAQTALLDAAVAARVPRFIPSDYAIDFTNLPAGSNRNLDFRREFHERLDRASIRATSVLNGMFTDLLVGPAPVILFKLKRVVYWENADQALDFTTIDDTADYVADAALDPSTPRFLRIAGDVITARELRKVVSDVTGENFKLVRAGGLGRLALFIKVMRAIVRGEDSTYPPWQGMQYLHNMFGGRAKLEPLDNDRYGERRWMTVRDVLSNRPSS